MTGLLMIERPRAALRAAIHPNTGCMLSEKLGPQHKAPSGGTRAAAAPVIPIGVRYASSEVLDPADQKLVRAVIAGDAGVAGALYDHLRPTIEHALRRVLHGRSRDFEDLVQTTFERVIRSLGEGRFEGRSRLATWAGAIGAHVAMDALRRHTRERRLFADQETALIDGHATTPTPERRLEARAEVRRLQGVLSRMKPDLADVLVLHEVLGYSVPQIAESHGMAISAVQSRVTRARKEFARRASAQVHCSGDDHDD